MCELETADAAALAKLRRIVHLVTRSGSTQARLDAPPAAMDAAIGAEIASMVAATL